MRVMSKERGELVRDSDFTSAVDPSPVCLTLRLLSRHQLRTVALFGVTRNVFHGSFPASDLFRN